MIHDEIRSYDDVWQMSPPNGAVLLRLQAADCKGSVFDNSKRLKKVVTYKKQTNGVRIQIRDVLHPVWN